MEEAIAGFIVGALPLLLGCLVGWVIMTFPKR